MPTRGSFNNWTELIRPAHRIVTGIAYLATLDARSESRQCRLASGFSAAQIGNELAIQTTQQRGLQSAPAMDSLTEIRMFRMSMSAKARLQSYDQADDESALPRRAHSKRSRDEQRDGGRHILTVSDGAIGTGGAPARTDCGRDYRGLPRGRYVESGHDRAWIETDPTAVSIARGTRRGAGIVGQTKMVGVAGFEPATPSSRTRCATRLRYTPTGGGLIASHPQPRKVLARAILRSAKRPDKPAP